MYQERAMTCTGGGKVDRGRERNNSHVMYDVAYGSYAGQAPSKAKQRLEFSGGHGYCQCSDGVDLERFKTIPCCNTSVDSNLHRFPQTYTHPAKQPCTPPETGSHSQCDASMDWHKTRPRRRLSAEHYQGTLTNYIDLQSTSTPEM